jgi:HK97 family phage prohead protease
MTERLLRTFDARLAPGDGRTIVGRAVPYNVPAEVSDDGGTTRYREMFVEGAFRRACRVPERVVLTGEHEHGMLATIGRAIELHEDEDGFYGAWEVTPGAIGDHALALVHQGVLRGLSVEAVVLDAYRREQRGVVIRRHCHLDSVGLCRSPAYREAEVLAVRSRSEWLPERNTALDDRLARLGIGGPGLDDGEGES